MRYISYTQDQKQEILKAIGIENVDLLFKDIPESIRLAKKLNLEGPYSELELTKYFYDISKKNKNTQELTSFYGGGCYDHFIPAAVDYISNRSEFSTAYTPYQPEVSQGTLQAIYEYQSFICLLTDMDVTNASLYDGASSVAEAVLMAHRINPGSRVLTSSLIHPDYLKTLSTYLDAIDLGLETIPFKQGLTSLEELYKNIDKDTFAVVIQMPNFLGYIELVEEISKITHDNNALFIVSVDPISLGLITPPSKYGADIVVGDGQGLGNYQSFGGPTFGFLATKDKWIRNLPGRIVGKTKDKKENDAFTLTLQTREQHIRRQRATSNICSNQSLNALRSAIYCALMGNCGFRKIAQLCFSNAHYMADKIEKLDKFSVVFGKSFFKEFVVKSEISIDKINKTLLDQGITGGIDLKRYYPELENHALIAVTEKRTKQEIDKFVDVLSKI